MLHQKFITSFQNNKKFFWHSIFLLFVLICKYIIVAWRHIYANNECSYKLRKDASGFVKESISKVYSFSYVIYNKCLRFHRYTSVLRLDIIWMYCVVKNKAFWKYLLFISYQNQKENCGIVDQQKILLAMK